MSGHSYARIFRVRRHAYPYCASRPFKSNVVHRRTPSDEPILDVPLSRHVRKLWPTDTKGNPANHQNQFVANTIPIGPQRAASFKSLYLKRPHTTV